MGEIYDVVIIGSGPAGLAAAIYAERAELNAIVIEKNVVSGGQVLTTYEVDNYPGVKGTAWERSLWRTKWFALRQKGM